MGDPKLRKVLHLTECLEGGVSQAISRWIAQSASEGVHHFVLGRVRLADRAATYTFDGEQTDRFLTLVRRYRALIREWKPDVVHIHSTKAGIVARLMSRNGAKIIYSPHCYSFLMQNYPKHLRAWLRSLEKILSVRTDFVVAVSPYEAQIAQEISVRSCRVILEPNIASQSIGDIQKNPETNCAELVIRAVGRYCDQKNPQMMASILEKLSSQKVKYDFLWIGSADDENATLELPISGWVPQQQVESQLQFASVLLHTAKWEAGVPLVALDAIRSGTPALLFSLAEYSGILSEGLFNSEDQAVDLVKSLSEKPDMVKQLLERQRKELDRYVTLNATGRLKDLYTNRL